MFVRNSQCILNYWVKEEEKISLFLSRIFFGVDFGKIEIGERRMEEKKGENSDKKPNFMFKRLPCFKSIQFLTSAIIIETSCNSL